MLREYKDPLIKKRHRCTGAELCSNQKVYLIHNFRLMMKHSVTTWIVSMPSHRNVFLIKNQQQLTNLIVKMWYEIQQIYIVYIKYVNIINFYAYIYVSLPLYERKTTYNRHISTSKIIPVCCCWLEIINNIIQHHITTKVHTPHIQYKTLF